MNDKKQTMLDELKKAMENKDLKFLDDWAILSHESNRPFFETGNLRGSFFAGVDYGTAKQDVTMAQEIEVQYSSFLEHGTSYIIKKPAPFKPSPFSDELRKQINERLQQNIDSVIWGHRYKMPERPYRWQRQHGESISEWGNRLSERGLLDNPEIRIQYQKELWIGLLDTAKEFTLNIAGKVYNVLKLQPNK